MTFIQKKHDPKVIQKTFDSEIDAHITKKIHEDLSLESQDIQFYVNSKNDGFLKVSRNQGKKKWWE